MFFFPLTMLVPSMVEVPTGTFGVAQATFRTVGAGAGANHAGFQFTATISGTVTKVKVNVQSAGAVNFTAELWTNNAGSPGTQIGSASDAVSMGTTGDKTFTFASPPSITASTVYWIVLRNAGSTDVGFSTCANQGGYGSGRHDTETSITDDNIGGSGEDWRVEVTQFG